MPAESTETAPPRLQAHNVTAGYRDLMAIREVTLEIYPGEIVALVGPNGAGKSTFMLAAIGAIEVASGEFRWDGETLRGPVHRRANNGLGFVPEDRSVVAELTVSQNLELGIGSVDSALEIFPELASMKSRQAGLLSGGEQQMLVLARQLAARPSCLLVDELSLGLAPQAVERLYAAIRSQVQHTGMSVLLVEQQTRRALSIVDRWYLLVNGEARAEGTPRDTELLESAYFG